MGVLALQSSPVWASSILVLGVVAAFTPGTHLDFSRGFVFVNLPLTLGAILLGRVAARRWLGDQRRVGRYCSNTVVGSASAVRAITRDLRAKIAAGFRVRVAYLPRGQQSAVSGVGDLPVRVGRGDVPRILQDFGADTVLVTNSHNFSLFQLREFSCGLESGRYHLLLAPGLGQIGKRMFDFAASSSRILLTAPRWLWSSSANAILETSSIVRNAAVTTAAGGIK